MRIYHSILQTINEPLELGIQSFVWNSNINLPADFMCVDSFICDSGTVEALSD